MVDVHKAYMERINENTVGKKVVKVVDSIDDAVILFDDGSALVVWGCGCEHCATSCEVDMKYKEVGNE